MSIDQAHQVSGALLALTSRQAVAATLRKAAGIVEAWAQDGLKFTPLMALHYTRDEFVHNVKCANMGTDWNTLLASAALMVAYLAWGEVYEYRTLLDPGVTGHIDSFLTLADIVEKPDDPYGM